MTTCGVLSLDGAPFLGVLTVFPEKSLINFFCHPCTLSGKLVIIFPYDLIFCLECDTLAICNSFHAR